MTADDLYKMIYAIPEARAISQEAAYWNEVTKRFIDPVLSEISVAHDFDFVLGEYSTLSTTAGAASYTIFGSDNDCRDVINVRYGDNDLLLTRYRATEVDAIKSEGQDPSSVFGWYTFARSSEGFPIIILVNTPSESGKTLHVRYRKKVIQLSQFPNDFSYIITVGVLSYLRPASRPLFDKLLKKMVMRYKAGGRDTDRTPISPELVRYNNDIADLYGVG